MKLFFGFQGFTEFIHAVVVLGLAGGTVTGNFGSWGEVSVGDITGALSAEAAIISFLPIAMLVFSVSTIVYVKLKSTE